MRHLGVMLRSPQAFVGSMAALPYELCFQFINVSQRALHIYELTAVECVRWTHGIKIERNNLLCEQAPTEVFRSIFAWLVTFKLRKLAASLSISIHDCFAYLLCLWYNKQKAGILRRKLYESTGIIISIAR